LKIALFDSLKLQKQFFHEKCHNCEEGRVKENSFLFLKNCCFYGLVRSKL